MNRQTDTDTPGGGSADDQVEAIVRKSRTSFYWAMRLLDADRRRAMYAIYAFCRLVDDIADDEGASEDKRRGLAQWRREIAALYAGSPIHPVTRALAGPVAAYGLKQRDFLAIIDGMEMDGAAAVRIDDMAALETYCDRVACAVGRLSNRVFGIDDSRGDVIATALGQALQLTNILRDLDEDADRDRLYLPLDLLKRHGIDTIDAKAVLGHPRLGDVAGELADIAQGRFAEADAALKQCDRRQMRAAIIMMEVYRRIFGRLLARGWHRHGEAVGLNRLEKIWIMLRHGVFV